MNPIEMAAKIRERVDVVRTRNIISDTISLSLAEAEEIAAALELLDEYQATDEDGLIGSIVKISAENSRLREVVDAARIHCDKTTTATATLVGLETAIYKLDSGGGGVTISSEAALRAAKKIVITGMDEAKMYGYERIAFIIDAEFAELLATIKREFKPGLVFETRDSGKHVSVPYSSITAIIKALAKIEGEK